MGLDTRITLFKEYKKLFKHFKDKKDILVKDKVLGEGFQGKVYRYFKKHKGESEDDNGMAIKKMYLDKTESKYVDNIFSTKALAHGPFLEIASNQLTNELVLQKICPNFMLNYHYEFIEREGICSDLYPQSSFFYNEFINNAETYTDWVSRPHSEQLWYNAYFQISSGIYALQKYFNMTHLDLHSDNVLVKKVKKGGYWKYIINNREYIVPNLGYVFYICDFGHAWIPSEFQSWYMAQKYKNKKIHKAFDISQLFYSTLDFSESPKHFKKHIKQIIKTLTKDEKFEEIIEDVWGERYHKKRPGKLLNTFNLNTKIKSKNIPKKLRHLVLH